MGELAVGAVDLAPLVIEREDLGAFLGQDRVQRVAARHPVGQCLLGSAGIPTVRTNLTKVQHPGGAPQRPASCEGLIEQTEESGFGGRIDTTWDTATQPQPSFPSTSVSLTASSLTASDNRATSAFAASSS